VTASVNINSQSQLGKRGIKHLPIYQTENGVIVLILLHSRETSDTELAALHSDQVTAAI